ncbi:MAG: mechanosensitive ion channel family protein [Acidimicrobiales bacterium]
MTLSLTWTLILIALIGGGAIAAVWFVSNRMISRTRWSEPTKATIRDLFHGPGVALIAGYAVILAEAAIWNVYSASLDSLFEPSSFAVIVSLVVLWSFVSIAATAVRRHVISQRRPGGRDLIYGIYTAGLLTLVIIVLESPIVPRIAASTWTIIGFLVGILVTYIVAHIINIIMDRYLQGLADRQPRLKTVYSFIRRLILVGVILIGVAVTTYASFPSTAGTVTGLILAAGFLSIVLGLAAQSTLSNLVSGMMVSITQPFQIGDAVVFGGEWCIVEDIRLTYSVLRTWDLRRLMVPNSMFQSNILVNYSAVDPTMLVIVYMVITFESNVDRAREIMVEEARKHPDFHPLGNLPITHVMDYQGGGSYGGVNLRLLSAARDQSTAFQVEKDLLYAIRGRFQKEGISIAYPTQRIVLEPGASVRAVSEDQGTRPGPMGPAGPPP